MDMNDSAEIQLSQSATDVGVHIELPGLGVESMLQEILAGGEETTSDKSKMTEAPPTPGLIATSESSLSKKIGPGINEKESEVRLAGKKERRTK